MKQGVDIVLGLIVSVIIAASLIPYGVQHYLSLAGSLVFIPIIMVPAMSGTDVRILSY